MNFLESENNKTSVPKFKSYKAELLYYEQRLKVIKEKIKDKTGSFFGASQALYDEKMKLENQLKECESLQWKDEHDKSLKGKHIYSLYRAIEASLGKSIDHTYITDLLLKNGIDIYERNNDEIDSLKSKIISWIKEDNERERIREKIKRDMEATSELGGEEGREWEINLEEEEVEDILRIGLNVLYEVFGKSEAYRPLRTSDIKGLEQEIRRFSKEDYNKHYLDLFPKAMEDTLKFYGDYADPNDPPPFYEVMESFESNFNILKNEKDREYRKHAAQKDLETKIQRELETENSRMQMTKKEIQAEQRDLTNRIKYLKKEIQKKCKFWQSPDDYWFLVDETLKDILNRYDEFTRPTNDEIMEELKNTIRPHIPFSL